MKNMRRVSVILVLSLILNGANAMASSRCLTNKQTKIADKIAKVTSENWDEYGVLPSVAVAQAFIESSLGKNCCASNNLWGIASGGESYSSLENGVIRYLEVINNGCYNGAPFQKDYRIQLRKILDGGYCEPVGSYYENAVWGIEHYDFDRYDKELNLYALKFSKKCQSYVAQMNSKKAGNTTVLQIDGYFFDTEQNDDLEKGVILVPKKKLDGRVVTVNIFENVMG